MGTRAIITIKRKPFAATHWDGYPGALGRELVEDKAHDKYQIIKIAEKHDIDFIEKNWLEELNKERVEVIARRNGLTIEEVKNGVRGVVRSNLDSLIGDIKDYEDWCEYQYNLNSEGRWEFAEYPGKWKGTKEEFKDLKKFLADEGILKHKTKSDEYVETLGDAFGYIQYVLERIRDCDEGEEHLIDDLKVAQSRINKALCDIRDKSQLEKVLEVFDLFANQGKLQDFLDKLDQFELDRLYSHELLDYCEELLP
ncbi:MAG: hypothetical protein R6U96_13135 [Promethearchaeia archaeon]